MLSQPSSGDQGLPGQHSVLHVLLKALLLQFHPDEELSHASQGEDEQPHPGGDQETGEHQRDPALGGPPGNPEPVLCSLMFCYFREEEQFKITSQCGFNISL